MRVAILLLAVAAVLAAAWFLFLGVPASPPGPGGAGTAASGAGGTGDPEDGTGGGGAGGPAAAGTPGARPVGPAAAPPRADPAIRDERLRAAPGGDERRRPPGPAPAGGAGEIPAPADLPAADREAVEKVKLALTESELENLDWKGTPLRDVLAEISVRTGVAISLEGEDLETEPVEFRAKEPQPALEVVREITVKRNLRFEVTGTKVVVKR
jgi:hypothetical protein